MHIPAVLCIIIRRVARQLNKPIPKDLVPILTKDSEKAKAIVEKSSQDAASVKARNIGGAAGTSANPSVAPTAGGVALNASSGGVKKTVAGAAKPQKMVIQAIPPFNPNKAKATKKDGEAGAGLSVKITAPGGKKDSAEREPSPTNPAFRLSINAPSFRPVSPKRQGLKERGRADWRLGLVWLRAAWWVL